MEESLQQDAFLATLPKEDAQKLINAMSTKKVVKGEVLIHEGEPQKAAFLILNGSVEKIHKGEEVVLLRKGTFAGMLHLLTEDPSYATLTAVEDGEVSMLTSVAFHNLINDPNNKSLSHAYITFLSKQLRKHSKALNKLRGKLEQDTKLQVAFFDNKRYMQVEFEKENANKFNIKWFHTRLLKETADLATGCPVVCCFVNDDLGGDCIKKLAQGGVKLIAMRCAGFDNVDLEACKEHGIKVTRVPAYSPNAVAEFAITLMLTLNRRVHKSYVRVKEFNFSLNNLVGFDMHGKTVGLLGAGKIGKIVAKILLAFGCNVLVFDIVQDEELKSWGAVYCSKDDILSKSDIISLHTPLLPSTKHIINAEAIDKMKKGVMIINTGRGGLIDSQALLKALQEGKIGSAGLDVYEQEKAYFFEDRSDETMGDAILSQLISCPNVVITSHQAFLTHEALSNIAKSTLDSIQQFESGSALTNEVKA